MARNTNSTICLVATILLVIGGLNWGLVGISSLLGQNTSWNVVDLIFSRFADNLIGNLVYVVVGVAAVFKLFKLVEELK